MTREEAIKELERISEDTVQRDCSTCGRHTAGMYNGVCCYCSLCQVVPEIFKDYHERKHFRSHWLWNGKWKNEALDMAIAALREQEAVTKCNDLYDEDGGEILNRSESDTVKGCEYCADSKSIYEIKSPIHDSYNTDVYVSENALVVDIGCHSYGSGAIHFCPMCGRRLEEV